MSKTYQKSTKLSMEKINKKNYNISKIYYSFFLTNEDQPMGTVLFGWKKQRTNPQHLQGKGLIEIGNKQ